MACTLGGGAGRGFLGLVAAGAVGAACVLALNGTGATAVANQQGSSARALTTGTVELQRLMDSLKELQNANAGMKARVDNYKAQMKQFSDRAKAIDDELKNTIPRSDVRARAEKSAELFEIRSLVEARENTFSRLMDMEQGDIIRGLYDKAIRAAETLAKREGYDLIVLNDTVLGFSGELADKRLGVREVTEIIRSRKLVYSNPGVDVTDRLIQIMNNEYEAGIRN